MKQLPNIITLGNLLTGSIGILFLFTHPETPTAWFVWIACLFDFLDGFTARLLKVTSSMGKELDSLADVVSFGVLPSLFMLKFLEKSGTDQMVLPWLALLLAAAAAWRLAKFNTDSRQAYGFLGLPTPAHALFITGLPALLAVTGLQNFNLILGLVAIGFMAFLMTSEVPMPALKFKTFNWSENKLTYLLVLSGLILFIMLQEAGIAATILFYIIISFFSPKSSSASNG